MHSALPYTNLDIGAHALKPLAFLGTSLDELRAFPDAARREAGHQLDRVQRGLEPDDWKSDTECRAGCARGADARSGRRIPGVLHRDAA